MIILHSSDSPYLVLWYLYLLFFGVVIAVNCIAQLIRLIISWRIRVLLKTHKKVETS